MQTLPNEKIEKQGSYAGFLPRLVAFFIDWVVVSLGVALIKGIFLSGLETWSVMTMDILFSYSIIDILAWLLKMSYFVISLYCTQTTLGKYLMKLKVVGAETEEISLFQILYREVVGRFLSSFVFIGYLIIIGDKEKAALHDKLADTRVVYSCNVKVTKKVVVTKVWNNQSVAQASAQSVEVNVAAEVVEIVPEDTIEEDIQAALKNAEESVELVDVADLVSEAQENKNRIEEKEEEEKEKNEVI